MTAVAAALLLAAGPLAASAAGGLQAELDAAAPGAVVVVPAGTHAGPFTISKPLVLRGEPGAALDGGGRGTVLTIKAPGVTVEDLLIRGTGESLMFEDAGVRVEAASATLRRCVIEDALFGAFISEAPGALVEDSVLRGKPIEIGRRGDLLRAWNSDRVTVRRTRFEGGRDMVLWFSTGSVVEANEISGGRYGLHFMYTNGARVAGNRFRDNSVGFYIMYSRGVLVEDNRFERHRGPSGAGLGLKESGALVVRGNLFQGNRQGVYVDQSPLTEEDANLFEGNSFAHNDIGAALLPGVKHNLFTANSFVDNLQQVSRRGGGALDGNAWSRDGRGNYWSDYAGYSPAGARTGGAPHRVDGVMEALLDRNPAARWFLYSPAAAALELASRAFPIFLPKPVLVDPAPLLRPEAPSLPVPAGEVPAGPPTAAAALLAGAGLLGAAASRGGRAGARAGAGAASGSALVARGVGKAFGARRVLSGVDFEMPASGALVLWGANGAGKSTFIKCALGLLSYEGTIELFGLDAARRGDEARRRVGYVPQHAAAGENSVEEAMRFVCEVRGLDFERGRAALERVGLAAEAAKLSRELSGGMRQKLALAQALVAEPELLVLDEPCASLDLPSRREFLGLLRSLKDGRAILMTSHRLEEVELLADRVLWLEEGRPPRLLEAAAFLAEMDGRRPLHLELAAPGEAARAAEVLRARGLAAEPEARGVRAEVPAGGALDAVRALEAAGVAVRDLRRGEPS